MKIKNLASFVFASALSLLGCGNGFNSSLENKCDLQSYDQCLAKGTNKARCLSYYCHEPLPEEKGYTLEREFPLTIIYPEDSAIEGLKEKIASKIMNCSQEIVSYLGIHNPDELVVRFYFDYQPGSVSSHASKNYVHYRIPADDIDDVFIAQVEDDLTCIDAHELAHALARDLPKGLAEEGFAEFIDTIVMNNLAHSNAMYLVIDFACTEEGWCGEYVINEERGKFLFPYSIVHSPGHGASGYPYLYASGMCLWAYIQGNYNDNRIRKIIDKLEGINNDSNFIGDVLAPVLGETATRKIERKFDYGRSFNDIIQPTEVVPLEKVDSCQSLKADWWDKD